MKTLLRNRKANDSGKQWISLYEFDRPPLEKNNKWDSKEWTKFQLKIKLKALIREQLINKSSARDYRLLS